MSDYKVTDTQLTAVANAIRSKTGGSELLEFPDGFVGAVNGITATLEIWMGGTSSYPDSSTIVPANSSIYLTRLVGDISQINSWSFSKSFTGREQLIAYTKYENNQVNVYICNPTNSAITIPANTFINVQYWNYLATI